MNIFLYTPPTSIENPPSLRLFLCMTKALAMSAWQRWQMARVFYTKP